MKTKLLGILLISVGYAIDRVFFLIDSILRYVVPALLLGIGAYFIVGMVIDPKKVNITAVSSIVATLLGLGSLGFTWASALSREDPEFKIIMDVSKKLMLSGLAL